VDVSRHARARVARSRVATARGVLRGTGPERDSPRSINVLAINVLAINVPAINVPAINVPAISELAITAHAISVLALAPGFVTVAAPATASLRAPGLADRDRPVRAAATPSKTGPAPRAYQVLTAPSRTRAARTRASSNAFQREP
jgi:hypothetical protein